MAQERKGEEQLPFFSRQWVSISGWLVGVVSLLLTIYFYYQSVSQPGLSFAENPVRTPVVKQGTASRLAVSFDGQPLTENVTAANVAIWNRGRKAIRRGAILERIVIRSRPNVRILEARVRRVSRSVVDFEVSQNTGRPSELELKWNILEEGDGASIQIVFAGDSDVEFTCTGVIEGQASVRHLRPELDDSSHPVQRGVAGISAFSMVIFTLTLFVLDRKAKLLYAGRRTGATSGWLLALAILALILYCVGWFAADPAPPFGF